MARHTGPSCKLCRREGEKLFLKGDRCYTEKCAITKRSYSPGQHGQQRRKMSEYGMQLREKQKARRFYGVFEKQFRNYFKIARNMKGVTGENLLRLLESRLDNVVYRLGFAASRPEARQLVRHNHFTVNGKRVNIPSYLLKPGEIVAVSERSKNTEKFKQIVEEGEGRLIPEWLEVDRNNMTGKVVTLPSREEIDLPVQEHLIVELYSK